MKCFIQTSKSGDVLSALPILHAEFKRTGEAQNLVIAKEFAGIIKGVSYVVPHIWNGHWGDLAGAIKWVKTKFDLVIVPQAHGKDFPIQQKTPSFQIDQYLRAGYFSEWDKLPLIFDNRDKGRERILRERVLGKKRQPFILVGDKSQSSPFQFKDELIELLVKEFPDHRIISLSEIRADYIFDLLGLYDKADALVTVETAHVHLSKASKVPTFVLAADGWRGSAQSNKFKFYCRYSEWNRRKFKLISEIKSVLSKAEPLKINEVKTLYEFGYNLSTIKMDGNTVGVYRYHDNPMDWKTKLAFYDGLKTHKLNVPDEIKDHSVEDLRLFIFKGKLHGVYTVSRADYQNMFKGYQAYGEIKEEDGIWSIGHIQIRRVGNDLTGTEKNWVPFVYSDALHFLYGIKGENQIVLQMGDGGSILTEHHSPAPKWANGQIKGGCIIPHGDNLLRFFHSRADYGPNDFRYFIGASLMENKPPFKTIALSKTSIMAGTEIFTPNAPRWKARVCIPYGVTKQDGKFFLSAGINDSRAVIVELNESDLKL